MKILLLGATGQIGRALVEDLSSRTEHALSALVRSATGLGFPEEVTVIEHPEFTPEAFADALRGIDHVIYGIGLPEQFQFDDDIFERVNCELLRTFLRAFRAAGLRSLTYISTYEVFEVVDNAMDETHPVADESKMTPYFQSMVRAYRIVLEFAAANDVHLTTIHPAAVYGGRNTGGGITDYMENLASRNWHRLPFINPSSFPVVYVDSLTDAIRKSIGKRGAYIVSDQMTSLKEIAHGMRNQTWSYVPLTLPLFLTNVGISALEAVARVIKRKPFASAVQIDFLTKGWVPKSNKAITGLEWQPMSIDEGIRRFLSAKRGHAEISQVATNERTRFIAVLELLTAACLILYWLLYFTVGLAPEHRPPAYFAFQNSFTYADLLLAFVLIRAATLLLGKDQNRRVLGRALSLICSGGLLFLGGLDITFNLQQGMYSVFSIAMLLEAMINFWCLAFGFLLAYEFSFDAYQRY